TLSATLAYTSSCQITVSPAALLGTGTLPCSGTLTRGIWFPYNDTNASIAYTVTLSASGSGGSKSVTRTVTVKKGAGGAPSQMVAGGWVNGGVSCAVDSGAGLRCWGMLKGTASINGLAGVTQVDAGSGSGSYGFDCVLLSTGKVSCFGTNAQGQLGDGTQNSSATPVTVSGISTAKQISVGLHHACALLKLGTVKCWGSGPLGDNTWGNSTVPVTVTGLNDAVALSAGASFTCAVRSGGSVVCWGQGVFGELGDNNLTSGNFALTPVTVPGVTGAVGVAAGRHEACAVLSTGKVACWGSDPYLNPNANQWPTNANPAEVSNISAAVIVTLGYDHGCVLQGDGTLRCWGENSSGQVGDGTYFNRATPVAVPSLSGVVDVDAGEFHTCARLDTGAYRCWGDQRFGQLGNSVFTGASATPVTVTGM
ncbi:MAG: hypothetical protein EBX39_12825, partial [Actinobacteria bacterium]|nr:hypothetical protein [Actinomycetota bacterium]